MDADTYKSKLCHAQQLVNMEQTTVIYNFEKHYEKQLTCSLSNNDPCEITSLYFIISLGCMIESANGKEEELRRLDK